jgi:effector-binding domain-containing protein
LKIFKKILFWLAILLLVIAGGGFLFPSKVHVERNIVINSSKEIVYNFLSDLGNWNKWSAWYEQDTAAVYTLEGPAKGVGATISWDSKTMGKGSIKITEAVPNDLIKLDLNFMEKGTAVSLQRLEPRAGGTQVTWSFDADMGANPLLRIMANLFIDKEVGQDYEKGLAKMKTVVEALPPMEQLLKVEQVVHPAINYLAIRDTATMPTISMKIGHGYGKIGSVMKKQKLNFAGAPFVIYYTPPPVFDMDIAIAVNRPAKSDGKIRAGMMKSGPAIVVHYFGSYTKMEPAYKTLQDWMKQNNKRVTGPPWEVYVTDPVAEKDTAKWQTDVYYPL